MIRILGKIPREITVAFSGGVDSAVLLDFLSHNHRVSAAFFNHGTVASNLAQPFVEEFCKSRGIPLDIGTMQERHRSREYSPEEHWRQERYAFLDKFPCVATAHHLDDVAETWIWSSLHGCSKLIPYHRGNVIRPLLLNRKAVLQDWARRKCVSYCNDPSNNDTVYTRNYIRAELMQHALVVNPGLHSMLQKKLEERGVDSK